MHVSHGLCHGIGAVPPRSMLAVRALWCWLSNTVTSPILPILSVNGCCAPAEDIITESDVVIPIPLHWRRFLKRRYNQSAELSRIIARHSGKPHGPDLLRRIRPTDMQLSHSAKQRSDNVKGVFEVPAHMRPVVRGKKILLVDDVLTTGATLNAATTALRECSAAHVSIVVFARVEQSTKF